MSELPRIRRLEQPVADAIAAGEVVERPASVVKELVENAIDAGARRVQVDIDGGGITQLRVADDGSGIAADELPLAIARHATSKITTAGDLERIGTLGFRGEALASIAAVAEVTITTRQEPEPAGSRLRARAGAVVERGAAARAPGTTVEVTDLFATTPARLRFLRSPRTESAAASRVVADLALSHPEVALSSRIDGRIALRTPGGGELRLALAAVLGPTAAAELIDVAAADEIVVGGAISEPRAHRGSRGHLILIVNRRWVQNRALGVAVEEAYRGLLPSGRHPFGAVTVDLDPADVDVNVHPAKREVRFREERAVFAAVQRACWQALQGARPYVATPGWAPSGGGLRHAEGERVPLRPGSEGRPQAVQVRPGSGDDDDGVLVVMETVADGAAAVAALDMEAGSLAALAPLRSLGQVGSRWLVAEAGDGAVVLVDPHAAHEKVLYAELLAGWSLPLRGGSHSQLLLIPAVVECDPGRMSRFAAATDTLTDCGFVLEQFGPGLLRCSAVPSTAAGADAGRLVAEVLDGVQDDRPAAERQHRVAALVACHSAVRFGDRISPEEQARLLERLVLTAGAMTCPHGRPTVLILDDAGLRRAFGRPSP